MSWPGYSCGAWAVTVLTSHWHDSPRLDPILTRRAEVQRLAAGFAAAQAAGFTVHWCSHVRRLRGRCTHPA